MSADTGNMSNLFLAASGAQAVASGANAYAQSQAQRAQGKYVRQTAEDNALMAETQLKDVTRGRDKAIALRGKETAAMIARQQAAAVGQGVDVGSANVDTITGDTASAGAMDLDALDNDSWRRAWGLKAEAIQTRRAGRNARDAANFDARMTAATGGLQFGRDVLSGAYGAQQIKKKPKED